MSSKSSNLLPSSYFFIIQVCVCRSMYNELFTVKTFLCPHFLSFIHITFMLHWKRVPIYTMLKTEAMCNILIRKFLLCWCRSRSMTGDATILCARTKSTLSLILRIGGVLSNMHKVWNGVKRMNYVLSVQFLFASVKCKSWKDIDDLCCNYCLILSVIGTRFLVLARIYEVKYCP